MDAFDLQEKDQLESARAEMGQVREENLRLKQYLDQIMRDYNNLQMQFLDVAKQGDHKPSVDAIRKHKDIDDQGTGRESELVSLSLGRAPSSSDSKKEQEKIDKPLSSSPKKGNVDKEKFQLEEEDQELKLGLECKFEVEKPGTIESTLPTNLSPTNSFEEQREEEPGQTWPPSKAPKTMRSGDNEVSQQDNNNPVKKARVSVRARCDAPTMNDGCQWRKYGQKIAKGNPCPRAYYRCTVGPSCPVRKQVQRCAEDMSILTTTYEGTHNHPLPMSATAMASTTSAAAQMLLSGSSSSSSNPGQGPSTATNLHGMNYHLSPETLRPGGAIRSPFYLPTASSLSSCPTVTLDLTSSNPSSSSSSHLFTRFNPSTYSTYPPILSSSRPFSSTSTLSFGSSDSIPSALPITSWGINTGGSGLPSYATSSGYINKSQEDNKVGSIYQSYLQKNSSSSSNIALPDTIAAATKAITADPSFQSVLAAALKSIIGSRNGIGPGNSGGAQ
ncbi:hypothetical protein CDL15_Pgr014737 [Punica granatum]|uniref:WRKY domain-containing protein n=1 Tax=Punica granatum TaxID=22663 RepID=A0A218XZQ6_PUNGR|nr:hypothetical protein CDL15_Pgr014737 [Punica granatum]